MLVSPIFCLQDEGLENCVFWKFWAPPSDHLVLKEVHKAAGAIFFIRIDVLCRTVGDHRHLDFWPKFRSFSFRFFTEVTVSIYRFGRRRFSVELCLEWEKDSKKTYTVFERIFLRISRSQDRYPETVSKKSRRKKSRLHRGKAVAR